MSRAQAQTKTHALLERLNCIRLNKADIIEAQLGYVEFQASGLKKSDPSSYFGIRGMIAALRNDNDELLAAESQIEARFPDDAQEQLNLLRSYVAIRDYASVRRVANRFIHRFEPNADLAGQVVCMLLMAGCVDDGRMIADQALDSLPVDEYISHLSDAREIVSRLDSSNLDDGELEGFLRSAGELIKSQGWPYPSVRINLPRNEYQDEHPAAVIQFVIDADVLEMLEVEDHLMAGLLEGGDRLFSSGIVATSVVSNDDA